MKLHPSAKTTPYTRETLVDRVVRLGWAVSDREGDPKSPLAAAPRRDSGPSY